MTRVVTEDLEAEYGSWNGATGFTVTGLQKAHGAYSIASSIGTCFWFLTGVAELYCRVYFRYSTGTAAGSVLRFGNSTTILGRLYLNPTTKKLSFLRLSTIVATGTHDLEPDTWYLVEVHYVLDQTSGTFHVRVDGEDDFNFSGDTNADTPTTFTRFYLEKTSFGGAHYYDDIAVNNTDGGSDNSWIGAYSEIPPQGRIFGPVLQSC